MHIHQFFPVHIYFFSPILPYIIFFPSFHIIFHSKSSSCLFHFIFSFYSLFCVTSLFPLIPISSFYRYLHYFIISLLHFPLLFSLRVTSLIPLFPIHFRYFFIFNSFFFVFKHSSTQSLLYFTSHFLPSRLLCYTVYSPFCIFVLVYVSFPSVSLLNRFLSFLFIFTHFDIFPFTPKLKKNVYK